MKPEVGSSTDAGRVLVTAEQARNVERLEVDRRRRLVSRLRFVEGLTEPQIVRKLATLNPPIKVTISTVSRDVHKCRDAFQKYYGNRERFDAASEVAKILARYEFAAMSTLRRAQKEQDNGKYAALMRVFNESNEKYTNLLQHVGLVDKRLGTLFIASSDKRAEALPTGTELQKLFDDVDVVDGEIVSVAEKAWLYGDAAASEAAAAEFDRVETRPAESASD